MDGQAIYSLSEDRSTSIYNHLTLTTLPLPPQFVIIDAMFVINTRPLRQTRMFSDYACFLFEQFVTQHFRDGVQEVHLVFDKPGRQSFNPKQYEHKKRYLQCNNDHQHNTLLIHSNYKYP